MQINFDLASYKNKFLGGAKQYLFYAVFTFPGPSTTTSSSSFSNLLKPLLSTFGSGSTGDIIPYLVRTTSLPDSSFEDIQIPYPGHTFRMAGIRSYGDWPVSFNVDEKGVILKAFNDWHTKIYDPVTKTYSEPDVYMKDQHLFLVDGTGSSIKQYKLINAWPKVISPTSLDYASTDIATMDVTFSYQYYTIEDTPPTSALGGLVQTAFNRLTGSARS